MIDIRVLQYFLVTAKEENVTKAAELINITQPTLSRQLIQLEEELGVKLFHRERHRVTLTREGRLFSQRAQEILQLSDKARKDVKNCEQELAGPVIIGCGEHHNMRHLAKMLASFQKMYPKTIFDIHTAIGDDIEERLQRGTVDAGLLMEPVDIGQYEYIRMPFKERWGIVVNRDSEHATRKSFSPEDLRDVPLIMPKRKDLFNEVVNWFGEEFEHIQISAYTNLMGNATILLENNMGLLCTIYNESLPGHLRFVPLNPPLASGVVFAWKRDRIYSQLAQEFLRFVKKSAGKKPRAQ